MTSRLLLLSMGVTGALLTGCASVSTMGLARTLNAGAVQGWVAPQGGGVVATASTAAVGYPLIEGGVRFGVTDHFELGAKLGLSGIGVEGKVAFLRSPTMDSGFNLSLNPGLTFVGFGAAGAFVGTLSIHLPLLFGIDFGGHELIIGPRLIDQLLFAGAGSAGGAAVNLLYGGGSVGFAIRAGSSFRILPEVSIGVPILATGAATGASTTSAGVGGFIFQAGLGFLFGTADGYEHAELPTPPPPPPSAPPPAPIMPPPEAP